MPKYYPTLSLIFYKTNSIIINMGDVFIILAIR